VTWPQVEHADLGIIEDDHTEDLRQNAEKPLERPAKNISKGIRINHQQEIEL